MRPLASFEPSTSIPVPMTSNVTSNSLFSCCQKGSGTWTFVLTDELYFVYISTIASPLVVKTRVPHRNLRTRRGMYILTKTDDFSWIKRQVQNGVTISCQTKLLLQIKENRWYKMGDGNTIVFGHFDNPACINEFHF
jgi:hypothetical protein